MLTQTRVVRPTSGSWLKRDGTLRFLQRRVLVAEDGIGLRETGRGELVVWLVFADGLQCLACLFGCNARAGAVPSEPLRKRQFLRESAFFELGTKTVLGHSRL